MFKCTGLGVTPQAVLNSGKLVLQNNQQTIMEDKTTTRNAIMRPCVVTNSNNANMKSRDYIVLSTAYKADYSIEKIKGINFAPLKSETIYWNEENNVQLKRVFEVINNVLTEFDIAGWLIDGIEDLLVKAGDFFKFSKNKDYELIAQMQMCNLIVYGNNGNPNDYHVYEKFNCAKDKLPDNFRD